MVAGGGSAGDGAPGDSARRARRGYGAQRLPERPSAGDDGSDTQGRA